MTEETDPPRRNWLRFFSPAVIAIVLAIIAIITSYAAMGSSGGWSYLGVIAFAPVLAILVVVDLVIKLLLKDKTLFIWLAEIIIMALIWVFWISRFTG